MDMQPSDEELLKAMQGGNEEAFIALYRRWQTAIYRFGLQMTGSRAAAEDATQEVFIALIRDSCGYCASRGSFSAWLYGIARHVILRAINSRNTASLNDAKAEIENLCASDGDPYDDMVHKQQTNRLRSALISLPVHYREVLVLCVLHEMNYAESACALGCSIGTIRSRLHRARAILAERLRSDGFEPARPLEKIAPDGCAL
jgi:RNA polymerase sigma-70 factor, ECF subfamily